MMKTILRILRSSLYALAHIFVLCVLAYALALLWLALGPTPAHSAELAIGDSIAVGLELPGSAKVGIGPKEVVRRIGNTPLNQLYHRVVILSTGLSNDPSQWPYVPVQLAMLKAAGAYVIVLGVGSEVAGLAEFNDTLKAEALANDMAFVWGWPDVHPANYRVLLDNIRRAECQAFKVCAA
jgi:hypothetical protein